MPRPDPQLVATRYRAASDLPAILYHFTGKVDQDAPEAILRSGNLFVGRGKPLSLTSNPRLTKFGPIVFALDTARMVRQGIDIQPYSFGAGYQDEAEWRPTKRGRNVRVPISCVKWVGYDPKMLAENQYGYAPDAERVARLRALAERKGIRFVPYR